MKGAQELGVFRGECRDHPAASCRIRGPRNTGLMRGEELLLLKLDAVPRRVTQDKIEAAGPPRTV